MKRDWELNRESDRLLTRLIHHGRHGNSRDGIDERGLLERSAPGSVINRQIDDAPKGLCNS